MEKPKVYLSGFCCAASADQNFVMEILGPRNRSKHCMDSEALQKTSDENGRRNGVELGHGDRFFLTNI